MCHTSHSVVVIYYSTTQHDCAVITQCCAITLQCCRVMLIQTGYPSFCRRLRSPLYYSLTVQSLYSHTHKVAEVALSEKTLILLSSLLSQCESETTFYLCTFQLPITHLLQSQSSQSDNSNNSQRKSLFD